ncbi:uncharacterized protein (TIGR02231 family) [Inhella inkyongensis]|uniref:Uncharacterized protein (TIGR02231 family) n=1 Tax=Inhella inkyongensis TaxID=392593 RepID=A0A840S2I0_9BURK|nr:DUF4139 domain-containing protein [Inhella inkyongensis]MBB5202800.1 uncharacterized protein (TIGR02231 family) [Inhella inkyongensis]
MRIAPTLAGLLLAAPCLAQSNSRLTQALVYPGGAELTRVAPVAAGARELVFSCLPARFEPDSLRASGSAGIRVGDLRVETLAREQVPECSGNEALEARIRTLEEQRGGLLAERGALDLVLNYLRGIGQGEGKAAAGPNAQAAEALRRQGAEALKGQAMLQRRVEQLERELKPLQAQRERERARVPQWQRVTVRLAAAQDGQLTLRYQTRFAGWSPQYQADLNSEKALVAFERRAEVKQATGEAWDGVQLTLSTRQPQRQMGPGEPQPWWLNKAEPVMTMAERAMPKMALAAPASDLQRVAVTGSRIAEENFAADVIETDIDAQFKVPGAVSLSADSEARSFVLEQLSWPVQLIAQVQPQQLPQAFTMATLKRPEGFFPPGPLQLLRDGQFIGRDQFAPGEESEQRLFFGPEDRIRVRVEPEQREGSQAGFIGSRRVATLKRAWVLENTSAKALAVQMVEAAPFAQHQDIEVQARFEPAPAEKRWRELDGVTVWRTNLAPKQSQRFSGDYRLSAPKDMAVAGWP